MDLASSSSIAEETSNGIFTHIHIATKTVFDYCCRKDIEEEKKENGSVQRWY